MNKYIWVSRNKSNKRCEDFYGKKYKTLFKDIYIYIFFKGLNREITHVPEWMGWFNIQRTQFSLNYQLNAILTKISK